jgi:hypothetical protein
MPTPLKITLPFAKANILFSKLWGRKNVEFQT